MTLTSFLRILNEFDILYSIPAQLNHRLIGIFNVPNAIHLTVHNNLTSYITTESLQLLRCP